MISRRAALGAIVAVIGLGAAVWPVSPTMAEDFAPMPEVAEGQETAIFAGGCFWCVESDFDKIPGVISTTSGYTGGKVERPSYKQVTYTETGHFEAVKVVYDPSVVSYDALLTAFWHSVDPTDPGGQFCDRGSSYRTAVFVADEAQRAAAEASKEAVGKHLSKPIVTPILDAAPFYTAETYHQDYYKKKPLRYRYYRSGCGRDKTVKRVWGERAFTGIPKS